MRLLQSVLVAALVAGAGCTGQSVEQTPDGGTIPGGGAGGGSGDDGGASSGSGDGGAEMDGGGSGPNDGGAATGTLAERYPGDEGIANDPAVVWAENFEEGSVAQLVARYDDSKQDGMSLSTDVPTQSHGQSSLQLTADGNANQAVDLFKSFGAGYDELYLRYYVKYEGGVSWHHTGVWLGGLNPPSNWPNPQAGIKPNGDDRFSVSFEPIESGPNARMDFYDYWMAMHSWMDQPMGDTAYYGNTLLHDTSVRAPDDTWFCVELHVKLNPDPSSGAGAELALWTNDALRQRFTDTAPLGYWVKDKFCPDTADGTECTDYRPGNPTRVPLDLQFRNSTELKLNTFWPQNYITDPNAGSVWFDDIVIAKTRVGCIR